MIAATTPLDLGLTAKVTASDARSDNAFADGNAGGCGGGCNCTCGAYESDSADAATATSAVSTDYLVTGMTCSHCVSSVTEELSEIGGVLAVDVDLNANGTSIVTVSSATALNPEAVRAAITEAGYTLVTSVL